jgi:tyrosine-protein phosphatase SIW14
VPSSTLVPEPLSEEYTTFMDQNHIRHYQIHIHSNKDGKINITPEAMATALAVVLNRNNHPLLIHCNRGKVSSRYSDHHASL